MGLSGLVKPFEGPRHGFSVVSETTPLNQKKVNGAPSVSFFSPNGTDVIQLPHSTKRRLNGAPTVSFVPRTELIKKLTQQQKSPACAGLFHHLRSDSVTSCHDQFPVIRPRACFVLGEGCLPFFRLLVPRSRRQVDMTKTAWHN